MRRRRTYVNPGQRVFRDDADRLEAPADKVRVLLDPSFEDLLGALREVESGCRRNRLPTADLKDLHEESRQAGFFSACRRTATEAPASYGYPFPSTQAAACRLTDNHVGFFIKRTTTSPGEAIPHPCYSVRRDDPSFDPLKWRDSMVEIFWEHVPEEVIEEMEAGAVAQAMVAYEEDKREQAEHDEPRRKRQAERRQRLREQFMRIYRGHRPEFRSELAERLHGAAAALKSEGRGCVRWGEFKKRWPSVADRHRSELLSLLDAQGALTAADMESFNSDGGFGIALGVWKGSQRIFPVPQVVLCVTAGRLLRSFMREHPAAKVFLPSVFGLQHRFDTVKQRSQVVGWLRVHIDDGNRLLFVDEVQSDVLESLHHICRITGDPRRDTADSLLKRLSPWHLHGAATVHAWGREIGYRMAMHGKASLMEKPGATKSERKWNTYYQPVIRAFGLEVMSVEGYPAPIMVAGEM